MKSDIIYDVTVDVLKNIYSRNDNISTIYVDFVINMHVLFEKLVEWSNNISNFIYLIKVYLTH
jgi:hypothetical protein